METEKEFKTTITHDSIKNQIDANIKTGFQAINEYIWNSIDAGSNKININLELSNDPTKDLFSKAEIDDNGAGIDFHKFINKKFLTFNNSEKKKKRHLSLPHGHRGYGRFSFIKICKNIMWESTFKEDKNGLKSYQIFMEGSNLLSNKTKKVDSKSTTGTMASFSNFLNPNDIIKNSKIDEVVENIKLEFAWVIELLNLEINVNGKKIDYHNLFKIEPIVEKKRIMNKEFKIKLIFWDKKLSNYESRYHFLSSNGEEKFTKQIMIDGLSYLNVSIYIQSSFFDDYGNFIVKKNKNEEALFPKEKIYISLSDFLEGYLLDKSKSFDDLIIEEKYNEIVNKPYFSEMFSQGLEGDLKKPLVAKLTKRILKIDEDILKSKNDKQNKIILNLINNSLDSESSRDSLIKILRMLLNEKNVKEIENFEKELQKYKLENIIATTKEIERRFKALKYFEKVIYDKDFYYYESDLQKLIEKNFWIFGEQYHLIGSENDKYPRLLDAYYKKILGLNDTEIKNVKCSKKEVDLMISRKDPGFGESIINTIVEIKRPGNESNLKEKNLTQIKGYATDIAGIREFNSNHEEWIFILVGQDYNDEVKYEIKNKSSLREGLLLDKPEINQKIYVKKWSDVIRDAKYRMQYLKEKLELQERKIVEEVEKEVVQAKGERQSFLNKILKNSKNEK